MTGMRTISGRVARVALVLAAVASLVTGVSVAQASLQRRGASDLASQWLKAPGLRWQAIARVRAQQAAVPRAHELALPRYYGSRAPYAPTVAHEQPLPRYYGSTARYTPLGQGTQATSVTAGNGFNWGDAGIGVVVGIGAMLLAGGAAMSLRKQGRFATH